MPSVIQRFKSQEFYFTIFILDFKYKIKINFLFTEGLFLSTSYQYYLIKTTSLFNHWISEIIIKTTFNNTLKDGVTSALKMMCVDCSGL
jgi:hypothetical protein